MTQRQRAARSPGAVVLGGDFLIELGIVRSLGRHGVPVWVVGPAGGEVLGRRIPAVSTSRYARRTLQWPPGTRNERVRYLLEMAAREGIEGWVLIPSGDNEAAFVARHHDTLSTAFRVTTPPWDILHWTFDKRSTFELARRVGVATPNTWQPAGERDLSVIDGELPVVLKPAVKEITNRFTTARAWPAHSSPELRQRYAEAVRLVPRETILVQRLIPSCGTGQASVGCLARRGRVVAQLTALRRRQHPPDFGRGSTFVETVDIPELEEPATRLLGEIQFDGLIEMEFKLDPRDGVYKLLDMNARPWLWHSLGAAAGVDFVHLLWRTAIGEDVGEGLRAAAGRRWIHFPLDLAGALTALRAGHLSARDYVGSLRPPMRFAAFATDDPLPVLGDAAMLAVGAARRRRKPAGAGEPVTPGPKTMASDVTSETRSRPRARLARPRRQGSPRGR
jgi:D-aspartate ligase